MLTSIAGIFRDGKIELLETPPQMDEARVLVTFLPVGKSVVLRDYAIDEAQAADLRGRLKSFTADWEAPEMDVYDAP